MELEWRIRQPRARNRSRFLFSAGARAGRFLSGLGHRALPVGKGRQGAPALRAAGRPESAAAPHPGGAAPKRLGQDVRRAHDHCISRIATRSQKTLDIFFVGLLFDCENRVREGLPDRANPLLRPPPSSSPWRPVGRQGGPQNDRGGRVPSPNPTGVLSGRLRGAKGPPQIPRYRSTASPASAILFAVRPRPGQLVAPFVDRAGSGRAVHGHPV